MQKPDTWLGWKGSKDSRRESGIRESRRRIEFDLWRVTANLVEFARIGLAHHGHSSVRSMLDQTPLQSVLKPSETLAHRIAVGAAEIGVYDHDSNGL